MDYLVSIDNVPYYRWQTELLIESFKMHNLEDNLLVAITHNEEPQPDHYLCNIFDHKRKILHSEYIVKQSRKFVPLRTIYSVLCALQQDRLKFPFCLLFPDMILHKPIESEEEDVTFHTNYESTVKNHIHAELSQIREERAGVELPDSLPLGDVIVFGEKITEEFFLRALHRGMALIQEHGTHKFDITNAVLLVTLYEHLGAVGVRGKVMESTLLHSELHNFINYRFGLPPVFNKLDYSHPTFNRGNPYRTLLEHNPSAATGYVHEVIKSYLGHAQDEWGKRK